jgi:hypothetical protein
MAAEICRQTIGIQACGEPRKATRHDPRQEVPPFSLFSAGFSHCDVIVRVEAQVDMTLASCDEDDAGNTDRHDSSMTAL